MDGPAAAPVQSRRQIQRNSSVLTLRFSGFHSEAGTAVKSQSEVFWFFFLIVLDLAGELCKARGGVRAASQQRTELTSAFWGGGSGSF